jgi:hypothetical protein
MIVMRFSLFIGLMTLTQIIFCQGDFTVSTRKDTVEFGQTADIFYEVKGVDQSKKYIEIDFSKYENRLYTQDTTKFEKLADVFVGFEDARLYEFYNTDSKILSFPIKEIPSGTIFSFKAIVKFLSYGVFTHPVPKIVSNNESTELKGQTKNIIVKLQDHLANTEELDVNEIKPIVEVYWTVWEKYGKYLLGLLGLIGLVYGIRRYLKTRIKKPEVIQEVKKDPNPADVALEALATLNKSKPWLNGDIKEYQSTLTSIVRSYLGKRYGIQALEITTTEIIEEIEKLKLLKINEQEELSEILQVADLVKFAKARPTSDIHQEFLDKAIHFVSKTKKED